jgi:hypothetical protein
MLPQKGDALLQNVFGRSIFQHDFVDRIERKREKFGGRGNFPNPFVDFNLSKLRFIESTE